MKYLVAGIVLGAIGLHPVAVVAILTVAWLAEHGETRDGDEDDE